MRGGKGALIQEDKSGTLACNNDQTLFFPTQTENGEVIYLARKLTPTECASLQGFEKDWCSLVPHKDAPEYKIVGKRYGFPLYALHHGGRTKGAVRTVSEQSVWR